MYIWHYIPFFILVSYRTQVMVDFFDSFGEPFESYGVDFPYHVTSATDFQVQSDVTSNCGLFCLWYLYNRALGKSSSNVISLLKAVREENDWIVEEFIIRRHMKQVHKGGQTCCSRLVNQLLKRRPHLLKSYHSSSNC